MLLSTFLKNSNWKVYEKPYQLNMVGFRANRTKANRFDDTFVVFFKNRYGFWEQIKYACTTDAGTFWLENPMLSKGTAILQAGQYVDAYQLGHHRAKYKAFVQRGQVKIRRDYDRNATLDFLNGEVLNGYYGINIHRATSNGTSKRVDEYSAGCQVLANSNDFSELISFGERHENLYGNSFTYGLIDNRMQQRTILRRTTLFTGFCLAAYGGLKAYEHQKNTLK